MHEQGQAIKFKLYLYGRRSSVVDNIILTCLALFNIYIYPKVDDDPELQIDAVMYCVSEEANSFRYHPIDLTVETDPDREESESISIKVLEDSTPGTNKSAEPVKKT